MKCYQQFIDRLFNLNRSKDLENNLKRIQKLAGVLGNPQNNFPSIHVAGTNGKGSVCNKIAECLRLSNYKVGLFTSPHIFDYRERIQINKEYISKNEVVSILDKLFKISNNLTFFEMTTLLAFEYFSLKEVDIAVIETGLGGRLDPTNILRPILSIITTIDYDHTEILGETLEQIAEEKAGIIKKNIPVVVGKHGALDPIMKKTKKLYIAPSNNIAIAREALKHIPFESNKLGLKTTLPCRYEKHGDIIFDVAHNPSAFRYLFETIKVHFPNKKMHVLLGMSKEKHIENSIALIRNYADQIAIMKVDHSRLLSPIKLREYIPEALVLHHTEAYIRAQKSKALLIVTGSFYIMSKMLLPQTSFLTQKKKDNNRNHLLE